MMRTTKNNYRTTAEMLMSSPQVRNRLKDAIRAFLNADCVDAYYDARVLVDLCEARMDDFLPEDI